MTVRIFDFGFCFICFFDALLWFKFEQEHNVYGDIVSVLKLRPTWKCKLRFEKNQETLNVKINSI